MQPGDRVLDVGSGPGHQAFEMAAVVGGTGQITGVNGISQREADVWADKLRALGASGDYCFSLNEYILTADKP